MPAGVLLLPEGLNSRLRSPVMRSVAQIVVGNAAVSGIQMLSGLLMARWIRPLDMGVWNTVQIAGVYAPFLTLGIFSGLGRELPYLIGKGEHEKARRFAGAAYGWAWALAAITAPVVLGVAGIYAFRGEWRLAAAVLAFGVMIILMWSIFYLNTTYRTHSEFGRLSANNAFVAGAGLVLMSLVWAAGFTGLLVRAVIVAALGLAALYYKRPMPVHPSWDRATLLSLAKIGIPIYVLGQLWGLQFALDRMVLVRNTEALGYFTLAIHAGSAARMIPTAFTLVIYPRLAQAYGETGHAFPL
jgi:O-antigen/teichoic acid export membrane protein